MYKDFLKQKKYILEKIINENILFNEWKIEQYIKYPKEVPPPIESFKESVGICRCCGEREYYEKYSVDKELWERYYNSEITALKEFDNCKRRIEQEKLEQEKREKIDLYKKAVLELKNEGKI